MNFVLNGQGHGNVAAVLMENNFDPNALRPYIGADGRSYVTTNSGKVDEDGKPIFNAMVTNTTATLRKDEWIHLDRAILKAAKPRLRAVADLRSAGLEYVIPNGLGKTQLEHEAQSDIGPALVSMDGLREGPSDRPLFDLRTLPLPITHKDFQFSARQVAASRSGGGSPLDTTNAELAGERVAEEIEKMTLGISDTYTFGNGTVYGYTNFPERLTKALTAPTTSNHPTTLSEVLAMRQQSMDNSYFGPWVLYYSPAWGTSMSEDYSAAKGNSTLRTRLMDVEGITSVKQADYLTGTTLLLVQQTQSVARIVVGMDITTLQWESHGGMQLNFKVMAIMVPQLRADFSDQTGIVHGAVVG